MNCEELLCKKSAFFSIINKFFEKTANDCNRLTLIKTLINDYKLN